MHWAFCCVRDRQPQNTKPALATPSLLNKLVLPLYELMHGVTTGRMLWTSVATFVAAFFACYFGDTFQFEGGPPPDLILHCKDCVWPKVGRQKRVAAAEASIICVGSLATPPRCRMTRAAYRHYYCPPYARVHPSTRASPRVPGRVRDVAQLIAREFKLTSLKHKYLPTFRWLGWADACDHKFPFLWLLLLLLLLLGLSHKCLVPMPTPPGFIIVFLRPTQQGEAHDNIFCLSPPLCNCQIIHISNMLRTSQGETFSSMGEKAQEQLIFVREDSVLRVLTDNPAVRQGVLEKKLVARYGNRFRASRRRNVYLIYVERDGDRNLVSDDWCVLFAVAVSSHNTNRVN